MYSDQTESLLTLYRLTNDLGLVVDAIHHLESQPDGQYRLAQVFGRRVWLEEQHS